MRVLVTGGNGFLGGYVPTEAARRGHTTVALARSHAAAGTVARPAPPSPFADGIRAEARALGLAAKGAS